MASPVHSTTPLFCTTRFLNAALSSVLTETAWLMRHAWGRSSSWWWTDCPAPSTIPFLTEAGSRSHLDTGVGNEECHRRVAQDVDPHVLDLLRQHLLQMFGKGRHIALNGGGSEE